ncbi:MAG: trimethylamine methyltransferase family protein, partial [Desulfobacterales bacterium]|nr:trimethylamine methyltransferase family protein [Desulfobacterales bacterium]
MKRNAHAGKISGGGFSLNTLTDDDAYDIHLASLEILEKTGVFVEDPDALAVFADAGADIDPEKKIARIKPYMVEDAIRSAPSKVILAGRKPENDYVLENNRVGFTNFGEGIKIFDLHSGELRETLKRDVADTARMVDAMSEIDVYERAVGAHDVNPAVAPLHNAE